MKTPSCPKVISMWSAPRSLSTVLLYSFAQHPDCRYFDEPFLWHYLKNANDFEMTGVETYLQSDLADAEKQYASLFKQEPGKSFHYVKNMACQWRGLNETWMDRFTHAFLIRSPEKMVASYLKNCATCCADDFALDKLWKIYQRAETQGQPAPVIDADDLLKNPELILRSLCRRFEILFYECMLSWKAGNLPGNKWFSDDMPWYGEVLQSTGFLKYDPGRKTAEIDARFRGVVDQIQPWYDALYSRRITIQDAEEIVSDGS